MTVSRSSNAQPGSFVRIFSADAISKRERVERTLNHEPVDRVALLEQVSYPTLEALGFPVLRPLRLARKPLLSLESGLDIVLSEFFLAEKEFK